MTSPRARYTLAALLFAASVAMFPNSVLFPASHDIAVHLHQANSFVGWLVSSYALAYVLATPPLGMLSDYAGRRRVLVVGLVLFCAGGTVPLYDPKTWPMIAGRVVMGIGSAGIMPMVDSLIQDAYPQGPERRRALAGFGAAVAVAETLAPFLGGLTDSWNWRGVFALYALALPAAALSAFIAVPPRRSAKEAKVRLYDYAYSVRVALRVPRLYAAILGAVVFGVVYFGVCALLPYAFGVPLSGWKSGALFLPIGASWVLLTAWLARRPQLVRLRAVTAASALGLAGLTLWLAHADHLAAVLVIGVGWGGGAAFLSTLFQWMIGDESPEMIRGAMNGIFNAGYMLGFSVGAPAFMWLMRVIGFAWALWTGAGVMAGLAVFLWIALRERRQDLSKSAPVSERRRSGGHTDPASGVLE